MMNTRSVGIYARVAAPPPAAHPSARQVARLRARVAQDGLVLLPEMEFVDEGYRGATRVRPARGRLRAAVATGVIDRLYIDSPDRLARRYADRVRLVHEFQRQGVAVIFRNRELGCAAEADQLGPVPGRRAG